MALTRGQGGFWLHRKLEAQCAPWYICWPQFNTAQFDHFRSLPCYLYCTSLFCLLLKKMTTIYLLGIMYLNITWSTPWGSEMTNDQGRLMILYIIDYIIKVNRASSMLNLGPSKIADWKHFPLWSTDDALMRWCTNGALLLRITDLADPTCCS